MGGGSVVVKKNPDALKERVLDLWQEGKSGSEIVALLSPDYAVTRGRVIGIVHRLRAKGVLVVHHEAKPPAPRVTAPPRPKAPWVAALPKFLPPAAPAPKPAAAVESAVPAKPLTIMELTWKSCRWPVGSFSDSDSMTFCGAEATGHTYCREHRLLARREPLKKKRKPPEKQFMHGLNLRTGSF
jgi:hypothetical protein